MAEFPDHLIELLKTSKYLHLATTSKDLIPSCSMMHYLYVGKRKAFSESEENDVIILATPKSTGKYKNMLENPNVALLVHDWVTAKKISLNRKNSASASSSGVNLTESVTQEPAHHTNRLLNLLHEMNQAELSQMSATLNGKVEILDASDLSKQKEYEFYKKMLLRDDPDAHAFVDTSDVAIIKVKVNSVKISDNENNTKTI